MCIDELEAGRKPYCVMACMMRVLDIGPIDQIAEGSYDTKAVVARSTRSCARSRSMADPELTNPSIVFVPHSKGKV